MMNVVPYTAVTCDDTQGMRIFQLTAMNGSQAVELCDVVLGGGSWNYVLLTGHGLSVNPQDKDKVSSVSDFVGHCKELLKVYRIKRKELQVSHKDSPALCWYINAEKVVDTYLKCIDVK